MSYTENIKEQLMQKTIEELLQSDFVKSLSGDTLIAFSGAMSQESIVGLGEVLRSELHQHHPLSIVNRVFAIYVEMAQNVLHYSFQKSELNGKSIGKGSVFVFSNTRGYSIVTANRVSEKQKNFLQSKCDLVNSFNEDEIKEHYLIRRKKMAEGESKGAGLGFIDMRRRSGNTVEFHFEPLDNEEYYFLLGTKILID